jgi:outer membrane lipoprotein-sorting protein
MAPNDSAQTTEDHTTPGEHRRKKAVRYVVPVAVAGVAAATIGLVPALAASGDPDLPKISAQKLVEKIAASDTEQLSGNVKISTDLGLPLDGLGGAMGGALAPNGATGGKGSATDPTAKLAELSSGTHNLRVAADGPDKQRVSIREDASEYSIIHNGAQTWAYDSANNTAVHSTAPKGVGEQRAHKAPEAPKGMPATPGQFAEQALKMAGDTTSVTVDGTSRIAGRDAYQLLIKPKQAGSTIGSIRVAVDAKTGTPLKFTLAPSSGGKAVVDVGFTKVDFAKPAASTFSFTPPKGAKVTEPDKSGKSGEHKAPEKATPKGLDGAMGLNGKDVKVIGKGWTSVVELTTPKSLPGGASAAKPGAKDSKSGGLPADAQQLLGSLGDKVTGKFGSGTVFQTRVVNALMTDNGKVYVGAVTKDALVKAANQAK